MYASVKKQMGNILESMENNLPEYLVPTISLLKQSFVEGILDANEIYRPDWGPLKSDLLEKIPRRELQEAAMPLSYPKPVKDVKGPWPKIIGETVSLINDRVIPLRQGLIAYILANLRVPDATAQVRESVAHLIEYLLQNGKREFSDFKISSDPYELVVNTISNMPLRNKTLTAAKFLVPFLKRPAECREVSELGNFFRNNFFNYTLLIVRDRIISKTRTGSALIFTIEQNNTEDTIKQFSPFEYTSWKDLLLAFISHLRRHQSSRDEASDVVNSIYGDLVLRDVRKRWRLLRNQVIAKTILSAVGRRENSARIQRLLTDVGSNRSIRAKDWRKALAFVSDDNIDGPTDATVKTLKALLASEILSPDILKANIVELTNMYNNRFDEERSKCVSQLERYLTNFTQTKTDKNIKIADVDIEDLLQALRELDVYTDEYRSLQSFLSRDDLETKIGKVNVNSHPTRGRLLSQLLHMLEHTNNVDDGLRYITKQFVNDVAYEGYGAGTPLLRST